MAQLAEQGFGCMGFSAFYSSAKTCTEEQAVAVFKHAVDNGVTLFNSATFYGPLHTEGFGANLRLIKKCLEVVDRSKIQLMVKIGMDTRAPVDKPGSQWNMRGDKEGLQQDVQYALETLGVDYIDIIVLCRVPQSPPIEEVVAAMKDIVDSGRAKHIGLSEASANVLRRAHAVAPIYCVEQEWSLQTRDIEEDIVPTCRELGIKIVAYSPLGRGLLTNTLRSTSDLDPADFRKHGSPRFADGNFEQNLALVDAVTKICEKKGCTHGQLSLAWLQAQGPDVIPLPGTTSIKHLDENLAARSIKLTQEEVAEINKIFKVDAAVGTRYAHMNMTFHGNK